MSSFHPPFTIGLAPLALADWFTIDQRLDSYLAEKDRLFSERPGEIFVEERKSRASQRAVLDKIATHLAACHPAQYGLANKTMKINGRAVALDGGDAPLWVAARLVPDDLVLMRRDDTGWRLTAGAVAFPSSWNLREKAGKALEDIHEPAPGFGPKTRQAALINRIFDNLPPDKPVWRQNWGVYDTDGLHHPQPSRDRADALANNPPEALFIRIERQTLHKMPASGDILFTIHIDLNRVSDLAADARGARALKALAGHIAGLDKAELDYKGLTNARARLVRLFGG